MKGVRPSSSPPGAARVAGRRLRVIVPASWYHPEHPSGSSRLAYDEARYLASLGHEVWLVAMDGGTRQPEHAVDEGFHVLRYRRPPSSAFDVTGAHRREVRKVLARNAPAQVDAVHGHMLLPMAAALDLYGGRARTCYSLHSPVGAELRATRRGAPAAERLRLTAAASVRSRLEKRILGRSDAVTCDSEFTRGLVARIHGRGIADRMRVMPGWVDLSRFRIIDDRAPARRSLGWPTDRPVLFCLRRFVPRMGLDRLLDAAAQVKAAGRAFHLVVAGDGPLRAELVAQARNVGLGEAVEFPGVIPDKRLPLMYGAADAFVLPSAELECFGLIAIEAMACGTPVLATPVGAIPEILNGIEPRWLAPDASAEALAGLLSDYLGGRLPVQAREALRVFVRDHYSDAVRVPELAGALLEPEVCA